jgi:soluble lytic murein transglycosylase-like protein
MKLAIAILVAALVPFGWARADIYGFIDENGVPRLANAPLDERYYLFKKETRPAAPAGEAAAPPAAPRRGAYINPADRKYYTPLISAVAKAHELDPALLHAVITVESGYNPKARSPKGAAGLMQLMPDTAKRYAVANIWDPRENVSGGARYLRDLLALFNNDLALALAAYNAGEGAVTQHGNKIPPFAETVAYVPRVLQQYRLLNGDRGGKNSR